MTRSSSQTGDLHMLPRCWVLRPLDLQSEWFLPESLASGVDSWFTNNSLFLLLGV